MFLAGVCKIFIQAFHRIWPSPPTPAPFAALEQYPTPGCHAKQPHNQTLCIFACAVQGLDDPSFSTWKTPFSLKLGPSVPSSLKSSLTGGLLPPSQIPSAGLYMYILIYRIQIITIIDRKFVFSRSPMHTHRNAFCFFFYYSIMTARVGSLSD